MVSLSCLLQLSPLLLRHVRALHEQHNADYNTPCDQLEPPALHDLGVLNFTATEIRPSQSQPYCDVEVYITHPHEHDSVRVAIWLPLSNWNGRFQGTGGGGFAAGNFNTSLEPAVALGYAAGSTDAGLPGDNYGWANNPGLFKNFAYRSIHDMTVVGKTILRQFYGRDARYSYFNGCSTGGRQGYMEAQRFPKDYDGIFAGSPAVNWDRLQFSFMWAYAVQNTEGEFVPECVFDFITSAAVRKCDLLDGGNDRQVGNPLACRFDARSVIGKATSCSDRPRVTPRQARIFNKIKRGPVDHRGNELFYGIPVGASYADLAQNPPIDLGALWVTDFVLHKPDWDIGRLTEGNFPRLLGLSQREYHKVIGTDNADLRPFQRVGGKLLSWHGWADPLVFPYSTIDYRRRVEKAMGNADRVNKFYRLFMAPGVEHCGGGTGAAPVDGLGALVDWVEHGRVPNTLAALNGNVSRDLCAYPLELRYKGKGDVDKAGSWSCVSREM